MHDTICAIATSMNNANAISIIRISGEDAISITNNIFTGKDLLKVNTHTIHYGYIKENNEIIDEVLVTVMKAPKTYTAEDTVEINCHGGYATTKKIYEILLSHGVRNAEAGEFTKRAFLNGRINLIESEAVMDLISAETDIQRKQAISGVVGFLTEEIEKTRDRLVTLLSNIEVNIDYPEYDDVTIITNEILNPELIDIKKELEVLIKESENGQIIKNGVNLAIIGQPNVGKSSILNHLLKEDKAIVTDIRGNTRDIVEGSIILDGLKINLTDTAGIRDTEDVIEKIGIEKSYQKIKEADLVVIVLNNNEEITADEIELIESIKNEKIIFINKNDLKTKYKLPSKYNDLIISGNTVNSKGLNNLKEVILKRFQSDKIINNNNLILANSRQINLAKEALKSIEQALLELEDDIPIDFVTIDIKNAWESLGKIIGKVYEEEFLDALFSKFCLGK